MRDFESVSLAETQSRVCYEMAASLKRRIISYWEKGVIKERYLEDEVSFEYEGQKFGGKFYWYLFLPFSSSIGNVGGKETLWVAGLESEELKKYGGSPIKLYEVPLNSAGGLRLESRECQYIIWSDHINCSAAIERRYKSRNIPRTRSGSLDIKAFVTPNISEITDLRILLEDAVGENT